MSKGAWLASFLVVLIVFAVLILEGDIHLSADLGKAEGTASSAERVPPAEFLYLDSVRVSSYLAQLDDGIYSNEKRREKLTNAVHAAVHLEAVEGGASSEEEDLVEREVTATAASNFSSLKAILDELPPTELLKGKELDCKKKDKPACSLHAGTFILFHTADLVPPTYLNPYLAIRRPHGLKELFPAGGRPRARKAAWHTRHLIDKFKGEVGKDPRLVLSVAPAVPERKHITYLLPMSAALMTDEESLLGEGGGELSVLGKVVRVFDRAHPKGRPAYVDEAALQTWRGPLRHAPGALICRTDSHCAARERADHLDGGARLGAIRSARRRDLRSLEQQTRIAGPGAVILPLGIYK